MTIDSFVEQLKLGMHELNRTGELGFVNGMIEIFKDSLEKMETTQTLHTLPPQIKQEATKPKPQTPNQTKHLTKVQNSLRPKTKI